MKQVLQQRPLQQLQKDSGFAGQIVRAARNVGLNIDSELKCASEGRACHHSVERARTEVPTVSLEISSVRMVPASHEDASPQ